MRTLVQRWGWLVTFGFLAIATRAQSQTITSFSPLSAAAGATVTITGTGFSSTMANNVVYFGAGRGTVTFANATTLSVTVPSSATYGPITVSVVGTGKSVVSDESFGLKFFAGDFNDSALTINQTLLLEARRGIRRWWM